MHNLCVISAILNFPVFPKYHHNIENKNKLLFVENTIRNFYFGGDVHHFNEGGGRGVRSVRLMTKQRGEKSRKSDEKKQIC